MRKCRRVHCTGCCLATHTTAVFAPSPHPSKQIQGCSPHHKPNLYTALAVAQSHTPLLFLPRLHTLQTSPGAFTTPQSTPPVVTLLLSARVATATPSRTPPALTPPHVVGTRTHSTPNPQTQRPQTAGARQTPHDRAHSQHLGLSQTMHAVTKKSSSSRSSSRNTEGRTLRRTMHAVTAAAAAGAAAVLQPFLRCCCPAAEPHNSNT